MEQSQLLDLINPKYNLYRYTSTEKGFREDKLIKIKLSNKGKLKLKEINLKLEPINTNIFNDMITETIISDYINVHNNHYCYIECNNGSLSYIINEKGKHLFRCEGQISYHIQTHNNIKKLYFISSESITNTDLKPDKVVKLLDYEFNPIISHDRIQSITYCKDFSKYFTSIYLVIYKDGSSNYYNNEGKIVEVSEIIK